MSAYIAVQLELSDSQALALAQLVKRIGWAEMRQNATSDAEAYEMRGCPFLTAKNAGKRRFCPSLSLYDIRSQHQ